MYLKELGSPNPAIHNIIRQKKILVFSAAKAVYYSGVDFQELLQMLRWLQHWFHKPRTRRAILYTRVGCHLCEVAAQTLRQAGYLVQEIDIDSDPIFRSQFDHVIPVIEIDGRIRFRGHVDPLLLKRLGEFPRDNPS